MPEHITRVVPRLDPLQARVVLLVIQRVPGHARGIQRRVREIDVGMIDECPIVCLARDRDATALRKQIAIERPDPCQILRLFPRIQPARGACDVENRIALGGRGRIACDGIDPPPIGCEPQHPPRTSWSERVR